MNLDQVLSFSPDYWLYIYIIVGKYNDDIEKAGSEEWPITLIKKKKKEWPITFSCDESWDEDAILMIILIFNLLDLK